MSVTHIFGFAGVAGIIVAGVDYHQQTTKAGYAFGELSPGAYFATYQQRFDGAQDAKKQKALEEERKARWRAGGKPYLPEAPEGWTRNAVTEGDNSAVLAHTDTSKSDKVSASMVATMQTRKQADTLKALEGQSWVYKRGNEVVFIEVRTRQEANSNSLHGLIGDTINGMAFANKLEGYAVAGGVGFSEKLEWDDTRKHHFRVLNGTIGFGQEIELRVHANASFAATHEILDAVDYDGLNAMLYYPVKTVGNDSTLPDDISEQELAESMLDLRQEFLSLKAREAQYRMQNIDGAALILNTYVQGYTGVDGAVDLTGGQKVSMKTLINLGYRKGLSALMAGQSAQDASDEIAAMIEHAMTQTSIKTAAEPEAPKMSPELAKELGIYQENAALQEPPEDAEPEVQVQTAKAEDESGGLGKLWGAVSSAFSGGESASDATTAAADVPEKALPQRLQLSGGSSCLEGSASKFCKN